MSKAMLTVKCKLEITRQENNKINDIEDYEE